jgi:lysophospholipase L1-like esterase
MQPTRLPAAAAATWLALLLPATPSLHAQVPATLEPTNAKEAASKKAEADAKIEKAYQAWVETLSPAQKNWELILQASLGSFYLPHHKADKAARRSNAWDFVQDDPKLPRILLIGDSVSRGYTQPTRDALKGKANVHRAPENCGPTANGLRTGSNGQPKIEVWLGDGKWDVIHFNFGIHDRATPLPEYTQRLEQLVDRMKQTGARLVWATTTPIPEDPAKNQRAASIIERNEAAAEIMKRKGVSTDDLFSAITPRLAQLQNPNDVHFTPAGYDFLGKQVAASIEAALQSSRTP